MHNIPNIPKTVVCLHCKREQTADMCLVRFDLTGDAICHECLQKGFRFHDRQQADKPNLRGRG